MSIKNSSDSIWESYKVTLGRVRATTVVAEEQEVLRILSVCL